MNKKFINFVLEHISRKKDLSVRTEQKLFCFYLVQSTFDQYNVLLRALAFHLQSTRRKFPKFFSFLFPSSLLFPFLFLAANFLRTGGGGGGGGHKGEEKGRMDNIGGRPFPYTLYEKKEKRKKIKAFLLLFCKGALYFPTHGDRRRKKKKTCHHGFLR